MKRITGIMTAATNTKRGVRITTATTNTNRGVGSGTGTITVLIRTHPLRHTMATGNNTNIFRRTVRE
jgi:hypothetical protein